METPVCRGRLPLTIPQIMCKLGLVLLFLLLTGNNYAQDYFVLIQSDHRQPFYVRLGSQLYPSSPEGHLILSRLKDSTYTISIGFPGQTGAGLAGQEQTYSIATRRKDQELQLKDHGEAGWGLYDTQTKEWLTVLARSGGREEFRAVGIRKDDAFSRMMAGVVQDTAVLYNNYADPALTATATSPGNTSLSTTVPATTSLSTTSPGTTNASATTSPAIANPAATVKPGIDSSISTGSVITGNPLVTMPPAAKPATDSAVAILRSAKPADTATTHAQAIGNPRTLAIAPTTDTVTTRPQTVAHTSRTDTAATLLYRPISGTSLHKSPPATDSFTRQPLTAPGIVKLSERKSAHSIRQVYALPGKGAKADTVVVIIPIDTPRNLLAKNRGPNPDSPSLSQGPTYRLIVPAPVNPPADNTRARTADSGQKRTVKTALPYVNSDCHSFATDYDVDKLRVKMLQAVKDDDRIAAALKVFRTKCFSTSQVRALSEIFTADAAKFRFFETAWPFAADEHFRELGSLLTDPVYSNKFKTMTGGY